MDPAEFRYGHARHLLLRAGFGASPAEVAALAAKGLEGAVAHLVDYGSIADPLPPHGIAPVRPFDRGADRRQFVQLRGWWVERMVSSPRPLQEKMTLFWHGLLTSDQRKVGDSHLMAVQNQLLRENATGNFRRVLHLICRDPAMLEYLDNSRSIKTAPNENFARELLELFTLGVGNYSERDVVAAARALTGWGVDRARSRFRYSPRAHDYGHKVCLGTSGALNGDDVVRIILAQDAAPVHLARRLLQFFAVDPTPEEADPYAALLRSEDFEIRPVLRALFRSRWFYSDRVVGRQVKSPVMFLISILRAMGLRRVSGSQLASQAAGLGQDLMRPPSVKGWDGGLAWITSGNLLRRYRLARQLIAAALPGARAGESGYDGSFSARQAVTQAGAASAAEIVRSFESRFLAVGLSPHRRSTMIRFVSGEDGSAPLDAGNPAEAKLAETVFVLATAPEFQLC